MAKQGEINYLRSLGEAGQRHARGKPFSDKRCGGNLMRIGAVMELLPPVPARILDAGCGTGWTTRFLGRRGYEVVGVDISPDSIALADELRRQDSLTQVSHVVSDYESLSFDAVFDGALFFDSLHHAVDEEAALASVYRALKPGGWCVTCEPGVGHGDAHKSLHAVEQFNVTEKDMPPRHIIPIARKVGFRRFRIFPNPLDISLGIYTLPTRFMPGVLRRWDWLRRLYSMASVNYKILRAHRGGITVLIK